MKKNNTAILTTFLAGMISGPSGATTLSEMRALNASQKPGMTVICHGTTVIPVKGVTEPVIIEDKLQGYVVSNTGDRMVLDTTYEQSEPGKGPFRTVKFRMTTTLEVARQKMEVDTGTLKIMVPKARHLESGLREEMEATPVSYADYGTYRITALPAYEILPGRDNPGAPSMHCAPVMTASVPGETR